MSANPLISVIMPTCGRPQLLRRAVASVLGQTCADWELLIINDGVKDALTALQSEVNDPRIVFLKHEECRGAAAARNTGLARARGAFIAFLDDDDEYYPAALDKMLRCMQSSSAQVGVVHGGVRLVRADGQVAAEERPRLQGNIHADLVRGNKDVNIMVLARRECLIEAGGFDPLLASGQDWDLWLRVSPRWHFAVIPDIVAVYHTHRDQLSGSFQSLIEGRTRIIDKHREMFTKAGVMAMHKKYLAKLHALNGSWGQAYIHFSAAAGHNWLAWGKIAAWLLLEYPRVRWFSPARRFRRVKL